MKANASDVKVGETVKLSVEASENSPVYLLGVDQSVLLLKSGNDLDKKKVLEILQGKIIQNFDCKEGYALKLIYFKPTKQLH